MSLAYASVLSLASQRLFLHTCGSVYTDAVSFVTASFSMRLRLLFTRHRSRPLPKPGRFENAAKSGTFSKRYGFMCSVNGETALIWVRLPAIMARNLHSSIQNGESCTKFGARTCHRITSHVLFFAEAIQNITIFPQDRFPINTLSRFTDFVFISYF